MGYNQMNSAEDFPELSEEKIKKFLETAALYSWRSFALGDRHWSSLHITQIDDFCEVCEERRPFQDLRSRGGGAGMPTPQLETGSSYFVFTCVSCRTERRKFFVEQIVDDQTIKIQKFGELPRRKLPRNRHLQKFLKDDLDNYEKAVACLANEYGVAAFAYFRRVVENNIERLLDMIKEEVDATSSASEISAALEALRADSPMKDKITVANRALPDHLKPDGINPLGRLYKVLSEGVHSLSDAECQKRANTVQECMIFLLAELSSRKAHRKKFKGQVGGLGG